MAKPCAVPECVSLRAKDSYLCALHQADADNRRRFTVAELNAPLLSAPPKTHKYGAVRTECYGHVFDSKAEAAHYRGLLMLEKVGAIRDLELQPEFRLIVTGVDGIEHDCGAYRGDFRYFDVQQDLVRVIDVKGYDNRLSQLKRKIVKARYGIDVEIVS